MEDWMAKIEEQRRAQREKERQLREQMRDPLKAFFLSLPTDGETEIGSWDGGHDSGSVAINYEGIPDDCVSVIEDMVYDRLDYGNWAIAASLQGTVYYRPGEDGKLGYLLLSGTEENHEEVEPCGSSIEQMVSCEEAVLDAIDEIQHPQQAMPLEEIPPGMVDPDEDEESFYDEYVRAHFHDGPVPASWVETEKQLRAAVDNAVMAAANGELGDEGSTFISLDIASEREKERIQVRTWPGYHPVSEVGHEIDLQEELYGESEVADV